MLAGFLGRHAYCGKKLPKLETLSQSPMAVSSAIYLHFSQGALVLLILSFGIDLRFCREPVFFGLKTICLLASTSDSQSAQFICLFCVYRVDITKYSFALTITLRIFYGKRKFL